MQDRLLERAFAHVVVERSAGLAQEEGQLFPAVERVVDRAAQRRVGLDLLLLKLRFEPPLELVEERLAQLHMVGQPGLGRERALTRLRVVLVDLREHLEHMLALSRKALRDLSPGPSPCERGRCGTGRRS